jgi:acyl-CoA thioesterase-1
VIAASVLALVLAIAGPAEAAAPRILAFGDSLTAGYGLKPDEAFPVRLHAALAAAGVPTDIINGGVSGDTTAGALARLDWALADKPAYVLIEFGANDMLRGIDPKVTRANLDEILRRVIAGGAKPLLLGMKAMANWGRDYADEFDAIYPALAAKYNIPLYPFFLDGVALDPGLNQGDGLHPNAHGAELIAGRIAPYVERLIGAPSSGGAG